MSGALRVFLKLLRHHLANLHHHARQFVLAPARDLSRPLEVGRDLTPQGPDFFCLEGSRVRQDGFCVIQGFCDTDLEFGDFVKIVLFGGEVAGHGGPP